MKEKIKKIVSMVLAFLLAFNMCSPLAYALKSTDTGTITVEGVEDEVAVNAYRIMTVNINDEKGQPEDPVYAWVNDDVKNWVTQNYPQYENANDFNAETVAADDETITAEKTVAASEFYDALAAAIKSKTINLTPVKTREGSGDITGLPLGNYLVIIENGMKVYRPSVVNLIPEYKNDEWQISEAIVAVKSSDADIVKTVDNTDVSIGDEVNYTIVADVPQYPEQALAKRFVISDIIDEGLTIDINSIKVYGLKVKDTENKVLLVENTAYTKAENKALLTDATTIANFQLEFKYESIKEYEQVIVEYTATVNEKVKLGVEGNNNKATLEYTNNPYTEDSFKEKETEVKVYSYGIDLTKVGNKTGDQNGLAGAEFKITRTDDKNASGMRFIKEADGVYHLAVETEDGSTDTLVVDGNGKLYLKGLSTGDYYIWETKAPGGYIKLSSSAIITIVDEEHDGMLIDESNNKIENGYAPIKILNKTGINLPETGGIGTILFSVAGIVLIIVGLLIFKKARKKDDK